MRTGGAILLASLLALPLARARGEGPGEGAALRAAVEALSDEDVATARGLLEPLLARHPDDRAVLGAAGVLRFQEQRYAESVELLQRAGGSSAGGLDWLKLARAAQEITRDYVQAESEHFRVSTPKGKEEVLVPYLLETLEAQRAALREDLGWVPPGKVTVEVLQSTRDLARLSTLTVEEIRTSGTIALCKFDKLMIVSPKALWKGYDWLDTAAHEYTHQVVTQRTRNQTPIWLHEGLAKWEESRWRGKGGQSFSPYAGALLREAVRKDQLVTFEQMHPSMAKLPSQEAAALAFAEVEVAVEYQRASGGAPLVQKVLALIADGKPADRAVSEAMGVPFARFLAGWKQAMATRPMPAGGDVELRRLRFQDDPGHGAGEHAEWAEIPDPRARSFARLGEIMRERGRWAAARVELGKAMKRVGPRYPVLTSKFAMAAMLSGHDAEARKALEENVRSHPHYPALQVNLGRLRLRHDDWAGARSAFLLANQVDPFDPEIHAGLARAAEGLGDGAAASREARFAQILAGGPAGHGPQGESPHP